MVECIVKKDTLLEVSGLLPTPGVTEQSKRLSAIDETATQGYRVGHKWAAIFYKLAQPVHSE